MAAATAQKGNSTTAIIFAVFAIACVVAFLFFRGNDVGQLPNLIGRLGGGPLTGAEAQGAYGLIVIGLTLSSWIGLGRQAYGFFGIRTENDTSPVLLVGLMAALGAALWSLVWFLLGSGGLLSFPVAIGAVVVGMICLFIPDRIPRADIAESIDGSKGRSISEWSLIAVITLSMVLAFIAALAPPTAKDSLLYHMALPKAFVDQNAITFVDGNIASYLALGTEMLATWAMLLGNVVGLRTGETAAGAVVFLFLPLLAATGYGWSRELGLPRISSLVVAAIIATIPTAYHVASSGYIDLSLALYVTLATYALTRWWKEQSWGWAVLIAVFLGAALSVKLTAVFVFAAFALIVLLRARGEKAAVATASGTGTPAVTSVGRIIATGFGALLLAGVIASPWYIRTWIATGSPVFPFYMSIWPGKANGWDVERSNLFQAMNSQYGGTDVDKTRLLTAPLNVSITAQPEQPRNYDGVLGPAFLIGLPLLAYALWKLDLGVEVKIMTGVAAVMYLFWLFSSEQLRYLLQIVPLLAIAIAASVERVGGSVAKAAKCGLVAASVAGLLTSFAWFCQRAPLRVVLGGEPRDEYLTRNLDYYPYYQEINTNAPADAKVWLINMRRDTYYIDRPVVSDYLFEDWTLRKMLWESRNSAELRAKAASLGVQYILTRHDFLFDYDRSSLVDDKAARGQNEAKLAMAKDLILDPQRVVKKDDRFSLVKLY